MVLESDQDCELKWDICKKKKSLQILREREGDLAAGLG
jgi:hypothetical protein